MASKLLKSMVRRAKLKKAAKKKYGKKQIKERGKQEAEKLEDHPRYRFGKRIKITRKDFPQATQKEIQDMNRYNKQIFDSETRKLPRKKKK